MKVRSKRLGSGERGLITEESLADFGTRGMGVYADEVNLARAVPDIMDGLKPVQRRILWAASKLGKDMVKTARVVGETVGKYHPHSDASVSDSITVLVNSNVPTFRGEGNWGSLIDPAGAIRYTNCTLSAYGWAGFFDPNYISKEVTPFVPNYDDKTVEPVTLPALLPNVILNGSSGIGVGTTTNLPSFTPESVVLILKRLLAGERLAPLDFAKTLKYQYKYGGRPVKSKENAQGWMELFKAPSARVVFEASLVIDKDHKAIEIDDWPYGLDPVKFITKVRTFPEVDQAYNNKGATGFRIEMRRDHNYAQFDKLVEKVQKATQVARSFKINVTHRKSSVVDGVVSMTTEYLNLTVPKLIVTWLRHRVELEKASLQNRILNQQSAIDYSELLIFVAKNADALIKVIRTSTDPEADLMKVFKLSELQAKQVLDLQLRKISKLDQTKVLEALKEQRADLKQLELWLKKPKQKVMDDCDQVLKAIEADRKFEAAKDRKMKVK